MLAAAFSGVVCVTLGHPLDCVKVYQQTSAAASAAGPPGALAAARMMLETTGPSAFVRGMGPPLLSAVLMNTIMFVGFAEARRIMPVSMQDSTAGALMAGALSGVLTSYISTPFDWLKIQAQVVNQPCFALPHLAIQTSG